MLDLQKRNPDMTTASLASSASGAAASSGASQALVPGMVYDGGNATVYSPVGNPGACGHNNTDADVVCALDQAVYGAASGPGPYCGKPVHVTNKMNGKSVTCTIVEKCPGCPNAYSLDLTSGAFDQIGDEATGTIPISWYLVGN